MVGLPDIKGRADLTFLISEFYAKLLEDAEMQYIFLEVARLKLEAHLPLLVDFWEGVLFQKWSYQSNVMEKHLSLHEQFQITGNHFEKWLNIFRKSLNSNFKGPNADQIWDRAQSIGAIMKIKMGIVD